MSKLLFIAEKPSLMREAEKTYKKHKIEINSKVGDIKFMALSGHVCRLIMPKEYPDWDEKWADIDLPMIPPVFKIATINDKKKIINDIKKELKDNHYDSIIVGTDADTEGNGIYYLLENYLNITKMNALRFYENDLTDKALLNSFLTMTDFHTNPRDTRMTDSFKIRSHMDWLIGMNFTVAFTVKKGFLMRVGRVKAPTLKIVYDNSKAIDEFVPHTDYELQVNYKEKFSGVLINNIKNKSDDDEKNSKLSIRFETEQDALDFSKKLSDKGIIKDITKKLVKTNAPQLYKLSDIQVDAGKEFGYSPAKTLELVQSLYETHKVVSYPRTDGRYISTEKAKELPNLLKAVRVIPELTKIVDEITTADIEKVKKDKRVVNDIEVKKASHDALLPTGEIPKLTKLSKDELNVMTMIYKRLLALFLPPLEEEKTTILVDIDGNIFKTNGKVLKSKGWTSIYKKKFTDTELPVMKKDDTVNVKDFSVNEKTTTPPQRLTQATLIAAMENAAKYIDDKKLKSVMKDAKGLGMPSSRASIIKDLITSGYMIDKKGLYMTEKGNTYIKTLLGYSIVKPELTAVWETKMQEIKDGTSKFSDIEIEMNNYVKEMILEIETANIEKTGWIGNSDTGLICPKCGGSIKKSKYGWFCANKKEKGCEFSIPSEIAHKKLTEKNVKDLIEKSKTSEIAGFKSKDGKSFSAKLEYKDNKVQFNFNQPEINLNDNYKCPCCGGKIIKDKYSFLCENKCGFSLSFKVAGHEITEKDLKDLIDKKETKKYNDFLSKTGKHFSAKLVLNGNKTEFKF